MEEFYYYISVIIALIITIIFLRRFFRLCKDVRAIREVIESKWAGKVEVPVIEHRGKGDLSPTKSDVREFQDRIKEYKRTNKSVDQQWLESLIEEYNEKFNEDFHQYL